MEIEREQMLDLQHQAESRNRLYYHPWKEREVRRCSQKFYQERCMENLMLKDIKHHAACPCHAGNAPQSILLHHTRLHG